MKVFVNLSYMGLSRIINFQYLINNSIITNKVRVQHYKFLCFLDPIVITFDGNR